MSSPFFGSPYRGPAHTHTHALLDCLVQAKPKKTKKAPAKKRAAKKDAESDEAEAEVRRIPSDPVYFAEHPTDSTRRIL